MPFNSESPVILEILPNISLIFLSVLLLPLCTSLAILSHIISPFTTATKNINCHRKRQCTTSTTFRPRTVLVTGVGMSKGLFLARAFYQAGHRVIGADFEPYGVPVSGRFSVSLDKFYRLSKPSSAVEKSHKYADQLVVLVKKERVEVWVSCSGGTSAIEDGQAAEALENLTKCNSVQFGATLTNTLHKKHSFINNARNMGLTVPDTHLIASIVDAMKILYSTFPAEKVTQKKYIMKGVGLDDSIRVNMTLLPCRSSLETQKHLRRLSPSPLRPFVLQQFISGPEYCVHALIIKGEILAFTACKSSSSDVLMHYKALPSSSVISKAMFEYTKKYVWKTGLSISGHFSIDFILDHTDNTDHTTGKELMERIYPIECNPLAHTAVILFANESKELAQAYLSILPNYSSDSFPTDPIPRRTTITPTTTTGSYWIGHDLIMLVILPFWALTSRKIDAWTFLDSWIEFVEHFLFWKDATFEVWDPWPAWWLYCIYWPGMFVVTLITRTWWRKCNISTSKMFQR